MIDLYSTPQQMMLSLRGGGANANGHPYVDLGLPSGIKWATMNVGAETETDYGDYFMWGSVTPNTNTICDWEHAPFNGSYPEYNEEYFNAHKSEWLDDNDNGFSTLKPEFDAAAQIMGGEWRMPTQTDFQELIDNTFKESAQVNSVYGFKFTSTINGNSIFFPGAGYRSDNSMSAVGYYSGVWSSSLDDSFPAYAWYLDSDNAEVYGDARYYGRSVRGVCK